MNSQFSPSEVLVDRGFDSDFGAERLQVLYSAFARDEDLLRLVEEIHSQDGTCDLKRGEFYPEILRSVLSLKRLVSFAYQTELVQVQPNFGSNGSIDTVLTAAVINHGRRRRAEAGGANTKPSVLMTSPTYFRNYNSAAARDLEVHLVPLTSRHEFNTGAFIEKMNSERPDLVMLVSPNNPTGLPIPDADLHSVLAALPASSWAILDRTLVNIRPEVPTKELLQTYRDRSLVVLHSFSKYHGMSHHRIGVALYSNADFARLVQPCLPLGLTLEGCVKAAQHVLRDQGIFPSEHILANIRKNKELINRLLEEDPRFHATDFSGNYCLLTLPAGVSSEAVDKHLKEKSLYVMGGHEFPEPNPSVLRLHTAGPPSFLEEFCRAIRSIVN